MAFVKGQSGNPKGRAVEKPFGDALRIEIAAAGEDNRKLRSIASKLLSMAAEGDIQAIKEVANRLDGMPKQETESTVTHDYVHRTPSPAETTEEWANQHVPPTIQ